MAVLDTTIQLVTGGFLQSNKTGNRYKRKEKMGSKLALIVEHIIVTENPKEFTNY